MLDSALADQLRPLFASLGADIALAQAIAEIVTEYLQQPSIIS